MPPTPSRSPFKSVLAGVLGVWMLLGANASDGAALAPSEGAGIVVRVPAGLVHGLDSSDVHYSVDYESFTWLELTPAGVTGLDQAGVAYEVVEGGTQIGLSDYRFDPLSGGPGQPPDLGMRSNHDPGLWLLQLVGPTKDAWLEVVEATGMDVVQYAASNSFILWGTEAQASAVRTADFVRWMGAYPASLRIAPELRGAAGQTQVAMVVYAPAADDTLTRLGAFGAEVVEVGEPDRKDRVLLAVMDGSVVLAAARWPGVLAMTRGHGEPMTMDEAADKIAAGLINGGSPNSNPPHYTAEFLNAHNVNGNNVIVHINDDGVNQNHNDLSGRMVAEFGGAAGHHGTHVAGIILGAGYNNIGDTPGNGSWIYGIGMAPVAKYVDEYFSCSPGTCTRHAVENGANISNNSWGYANNGVPNYGYGYTTHARTWDGLVQDANNQVTGAQPLTIVSSAGNGGTGTTGRIVEPWEAKNVISVAATRNRRSSNGTYGSGDIHSVASFSSRGPCRDGRNCPVISAPGQYVISARHTTSGCGAQQAPNSATHSVCSGTSMSSPQVAGSMALITQWWRNTNSGADPSPAMGRALVVNGATDMGTANIPNTSEGWGRIHVGEVIAPSSVTHYWDQTHIFYNTGESWSVNVWAANTSKPLKVTLAWTDDKGPGNGGTSIAIVNNLNLRLEQGSTIWRGNNFSNGWSQSGGSADNLNTLENIYIQSPNTSQYVLKVEAAAINGDGVLYNGDPTDQHFALVCRNCNLSASSSTATPTSTSVATGTPPTATATNTSPPPTETPTPTLVMGATPPTATATDRWTATPSSTPVASATATSTATPPPATATNTNTAVPPTNTATPLPTATWTPSATATPLPTSTLVPTATTTPLPTATTTPLPTATNTPLPTATNTPLPSATSTPLPTATNTPPPTATSTASATTPPTATASATNTSPPPTATQAPSSTPTSQATATPVPDQVTIVAAFHFLSAGILKVDAYSNQQTAILDVFDNTTGTYIGTLPPGGGAASFQYAPYPPVIRVQSSLGGVSTAFVIGMP